MATDSRIKRIVMRRVRTAHALSLFMTPAAGKALLIGIAALAAATQVSVSHVIANMPSLYDVHAVFTFTGYAFAHTSLPVQALTLLAAAGLVWLVQDLARPIARVGKFA